MKDLKILEYNPSYAAEVARMWRLSCKGWDGEYANKTEEEVLKEHEGCTNINTFLAIKNEEVVGYCSMRKYPFDENGIQLRVLNARFDLHRMGIGKTLIRKVIERTIELGIPRIDLFSWAANKRAIPVYKRCGFFLEDMEDTTKLMNFIPCAVKIEAVEDYFKDTDWFDDLKRERDMEPDRKKENGFNLYEYVWEKGNKKLRMEFERLGRGLRLIETEDYLISVIAEKQNLVLGNSYKVIYEIVNKSGKPLNILIKGYDNKNIKYSFERMLNVTSKEIIEGEFFVGEIDEEFDQMKTHPTVSSEVLINGKKALFNLGIVPKFPVKIELRTEQAEKFIGESYNMYLDLENCLSDETAFEFEFPENKDLEFAINKFSIILKSQEKRTIQIPFKLKKPTIYKALLDVKVKLKNGRTFNFTKKISEIFIGRTEKFGGEIGEGYVIVNGKYSMVLRKNGTDLNDIRIFIAGVCQQMYGNETYFLCPKLGLPYSEELNTKLPRDIRAYEQNEYMVLEADYYSESIKDIKLTLVIKLLNNGIIENYFEVCNLSDKETEQELWLKQDVAHDLPKAVIPYDGKYVKVSEPLFEDIAPYQGNRLDENWMFTGEGSQTRSLWWDKELKASFSYYPVYFEHKLGKIGGKGKIRTKSVFAAISTFKTFEELRCYALKESLKAGLPTVSNFEISINDGNPFVKDNCTVEITEHKDKPYKGKITIQEQGEDENIIYKNIEDDTTKTHIDFSLKGSNPEKVIIAKADIGSKVFERKFLVFNLKNAAFAAEICEEEGFKNYCVSNGVMEIKASPDFSCGLYSLKYKEHEWLANSFPKLDVKDSYTPWFGGILTLPDEWVFNSKAVLKEQISAEFIKKNDNLGNVWQGIKTSLLIKNHDDFKGLVISDYYLMLPGVPVLCHTVQINQNMDKFMKNQIFATTSFINVNNEIIKGYAAIKNNDGDITKYRCGMEAVDLGINASVTFESESLADKLQFYTNFNEFNDAACCLDSDIVKIDYNFNISMAKGEEKFTRPEFYILTNERIEDKLLKGLNVIRF